MKKRLVKSLIIALVLTFVAIGVFYFVPLNLQEDGGFCMDCITSTYRNGWPFTFFDGYNGGFSGGGGDFYLNNLAYDALTYLVFFSAVVYLFIPSNLDKKKKNKK